MNMILLRVLGATVLRLTRSRAVRHVSRSRPPFAGRHSADLNAVHNGVRCSCPASGTEAGSPRRDASERGAGYTSRAFILGGRWELLVTPEYDDAHHWP